MRGTLFFNLASLIAEQHLQTLRAIGVGAADDRQRRAKLCDLCIGTDRFAPFAPLQSIHIRRQAQASPSHFQELLAEKCSKITHVFNRIIQRSTSRTRSWRRARSGALALVVDRERGAAHTPLN